MSEATGITVRARVWAAYFYDPNAMECRIVVAASVEELYAKMERIDYVEHNRRLVCEAAKITREDWEGYPVRRKLDALQRNNTSFEWNEDAVTFDLADLKGV